jgi:hypothetical protein
LRVKKAARDDPEGTRREVSPVHQSLHEKSARNELEYELVAKGANEMHAVLAVRAGLLSERK